MSAQQEQASIADFMDQYCEFCKSGFAGDAHAHLAACEDADATTRNHGGVCDLCTNVISGPLHEHLKDCDARDDVWQGDHPDDRGASA
jgi:hypothetical protein